MPPSVLPVKRGTSSSTAAASTAMSPTVSNAMPLSTAPPALLASKLLMAPASFAISPFVRYAQLKMFVVSAKLTTSCKMEHVLRSVVQLITAQSAQLTTFVLTVTSSSAYLTNLA